MKIGLQINKFTWTGGDAKIGELLKDIAVSADKNGFYSVWVMDHFFQIGYVGAPEEPMLEAYTTLGYIAGLTKKVKMGTMVTGVIYRDPALLVKAVTALDVLSGGRAVLGIGAAWNEQESKALGFNFPPLKERFERLEETLQIFQRMWSGDSKPFKGKHYHLEHPLNSPQALQKPHPPILVGGGGEKKTLRLVAQYADACNLFARAGIEELNHKLDVLQKHCEEVGRNYEEIEKTVISHLDGEDINPDEVIHECMQLGQAGIDQVIYSISGVEKIKPLDIFGKKIIPQVVSL